MLATFPNRAKMIAGYAFPGLLPRFYPQEVVIELTNHCNLACIMCPHKSMTRPKGRMTDELFDKIIGEVAGKTELVYLYGTGESLLHPRLAEYIGQARDRGLSTCLSTNGQLMDEAWAEKLLRSGLDYLIVAMDGGVRETYESIRIKGSFDRLVTNIKTLLRLRRELKSPTSIALQMIYMQQNAHEVDSFNQLFTAEEREQIEQIRLKPVHSYTLGGDTSHSRPCYWLWNMMSIYWNGDVPLCCVDSDRAFCFGNVEQEGVGAIWNSEKFWAVRRQHKSMRYAGLPVCRGCDVPEQGYFNAATILGSAFLSASTVRDLMPLYERYVLIPSQRLRRGGAKG